MSQARLVELLKKKGTGASMGKCLDGGELAELQGLFLDDTASLITKATLLCAIVVLDATNEEAEWLRIARLDPSCYVPGDLIALLTGTHDAFELGFEALFSEGPDFEKAVFLEYLRLKRETLDENLDCFDVFWERALHIEVDVPVLIDIGDPYDGFNRNAYLNVFVASLLASVGVRVLLHGLDAVGPKYGVNAYKTLAASGKNVSKSIEAVAQDIEDPEIGWGFVDQSQSFAALYELKQLRREMVKRPLISTVEKLLQPIRAAGGNHLVVGYTHPPYKDMLRNLLEARSELWQDYLIVRGVEGSTQLPIDKRARVIRAGEDEDFFVSPGDYDIEEQSGSFRVQVLYQALVLLERFGLGDKREALIEAFRSGKALGHWERGMV